MADSLMSYEPSDRFLHRLNPITKVVLFIAIVLFGMFTSTPNYPWVLNFAVFVVLLVGDRVALAVGVGRDDPNLMADIRIAELVGVAGGKSDVLEYVRVGLALPLVGYGAEAVAVGQSV